MSVISVQLLYCIVFTAALYSFEMLYQNKPFDVHERFMADRFKVKKSKQNCNQLSTDQTHEHINKIYKTVGCSYELQRRALLVMYDVLPTTIEPMSL